MAKEARSRLGKEGRCSVDGLGNLSGSGLRLAEAGAFGQASLPGTNGLQSLSQFIPRSAAGSVMEGNFSVPLVARVRVCTQSLVNVDLRISVSTFHTRNVGMCFPRKIKGTFEEMLTVFPGSSIQVCPEFPVPHIYGRNESYSSSYELTCSTINTYRQNGICTKKGTVPTRKERIMITAGTSGAFSSIPSIRLVHHTPVPAKVRDPMTLNSSASPRGRLSKYHLYTAPLITGPCHGDRHEGS